MDRRGFLKMLGKGAAAAVAPKGAIAKALTNTLTKAPKVDIGKAILDYISVYDDSIKVPLPPAGKYYRMAGIVSNLLKAGTHYGVVNADDDFSDLLRHEFQYYNDKAEFLDGKKGISEIFGGEYKGLYGDEDVNAIQKLKHKFTLDLDHLVDNFDSHTINPIITFSYKNNLISPEQQTELENYGFYKHEYIEDVSSKEKQFDDKQKRQEGPDRRSDIDYSRMDKAGGAEDEGYAKYYEKVKTFDTLVEAMDRRDFLKWLSKGASVAGANPKTVGKMLMNAAGGAAASSAPVNVATISQALKKLDTLAYNLGDEGFITAANQKVIASTLKSDLLKILPAFASKGINFEMGEKGLKQLDKVLTGEMDLTDTVLYNTGEPSEFNEYIPFSDALKNGFINQDFKNYYIDKYGELYYADIHFDSLPESRLPWDKREEKWLEFLKKHYPETYKGEKAWRDEAEKNMYDNTAKDIDYSRMDKAGGSEDEGYAKYYEKVKTFDSLLSFIKEEDDMSDMFDAMTDVTSPEGKTVYAVIHDPFPPQFFTGNVTPSYNDNVQLPKDAIFIAQNIWYDDGSLDPASGEKRGAAAYITDKDLGLKLIRYHNYSTIGQDIMHPYMTPQEYADTRNVNSEVMNTITEFLEARRG